MALGDHLEVDGVVAVSCLMFAETVTLRLSSKPKKRGTKFRGRSLWLHMARICNGTWLVSKAVKGHTASYGIRTEHTHTHIYIYIHTHTYIYIYSFLYRMLCAA